MSQAAGSSKPGNQRGESIELRDRGLHRTSIGDDIRLAQSSASSAKDHVIDSSAQSIDLDASGHEEYLDGGFGWVIVGCTFLIAFHFLGLLYAWGVIQADLKKKGLGGSQLLSLIGGLNAFFTAAFCLPTSFILRKYGLRIVGLVGVSTLSLSLFLCLFATDSLGGLIVLQGCCAGIANGALFMTVYPLPSQFFMRKRGMATGITSCGGGIGGAAWSLILQKLISEVGLSWTYRVLALSTLVLCLPAAYTLRPGVQPRPTQPLCGTEVTPTPEKSIFKSSMYIRVVLTCVIVSWPFFIPPFYLPQYAVSIGMTASQGALFSALYNISSGIGRIGFGYMADMLVGNLTSWIIALLSILLSSLTVWPFSVTFASVAGFSIWCGLGSGGFHSLQSSIVAQVVGNHRIHQAIGWIEMAQSFGGLIGPLTAGLLLEKFGGTDAGAAPYKPTMYVVGGSTAVATLLALSIRASHTKEIFVKA